MVSVFEPPYRLIHGLLFACGFCLCFCFMVWSFPLLSVFVSNWTKRLLFAESTCFWVCISMTGSEHFSKPDNRILCRTGSIGWRSVYLLDMGCIALRDGVVFGKCVFYHIFNLHYTRMTLIPLEATIHSSIVRLTLVIIQAIGSHNKRLQMIQGENGCVRVKSFRKTVKE